MNGDGGKPPADEPKGGQIADATAPGGTDLSDVSFQRLGQRIADLSRELSDITRLAGQAAPRKLELEAAASAFKSLSEAYAKQPDAFQNMQLDLFGRQSDTLQQMSMGAPAQDADADSRFSDEAWRENPFFDFVRRIFLGPVELGREPRLECARAFRNRTAARRLLHPAGDGGDGAVEPADS